MLIPILGSAAGVGLSVYGTYQGVQQIREGEVVGVLDAALGMLGAAASIRVGLSGRAGIGSAVEGGEAAGGTGPKLWVYTREPVGETLRGGAAGRAWATAHGPESGWATEPGFWNAIRRGWRTGRTDRYQYVTEIPEAAAGQFARVRGIGVFRGWKYAGRQYFTRRPGDLNLVTGRIAEPTLKQSRAYYRELIGAHALDAAQWGVAGWNALAPEGSSAEGGR